jgi:hypothetical protein
VGSGGLRAGAAIVLRAVAGPRRRNGSIGGRSQVGVEPGSPLPGCAPPEGDSTAESEEATMRSAYEAAMERLKQEGLDTDLKLTKAQKAKIRQITDTYEAQIAERKIVLEAEAQNALEAGDAETAMKLQEQLTTETADMRAKLERDKQSVIKAAQGKS